MRATVKSTPSGPGDAVGVADCHCHAVELRQREDTMMNEWTNSWGNRMRYCRRLACQSIDTIGYRFDTSTWPPWCPSPLTTAYTSHSRYLRYSVHKLKFSNSRGTGEQILLCRNDTRYEKLDSSGLFAAVIQISKHTLDCNSNLLYVSSLLLS